MLKGLFWNLSGKPLGDLVVKLCEQHVVDLLIVAECPADEGFLLAVNNAAPRPFVAVNFGQRIRFFSRESRFEITPAADYGRYLSLVSVAPDTGPDFLVAGVHLPSKLHLDSANQAQTIPGILSHVLAMELARGHQRTVVVGDFNMNPFEDGLCGSAGFHAVMSRSIALRRSRKVYGEERCFFYNPMWNFFGDERPGPPGTYYYRDSRPISYFWNVFDQVLYRPGLLERYEPGDVGILTEVGGQSLLYQSGVINKRDYSDHLPVLFLVKP